MKKLDKAKEIIVKEIGNGDCGIFNTRNIVGDSMEEIFNNDGLKIDICRLWKYFEVFGLSDDEFEELKKFYDAKRMIVRLSSAEYVDEKNPCEHAGVNYWYYPLTKEFYIALDEECSDKMFINYCPICGKKLPSYVFDIDVKEFED